MPAWLRRVAEMLGLTPLLSRKPSQLSGGQQQRVALGRAIIAEQPVCLMDEPLSNLDAQLRAEMRREIRALQQALGMTMIYVTHDQTEAMTMADQVILLREGRIAQDAPPARLYARPASVFAARFIGTPPMNLLPLADGPDGAVVAGPAGPAVLPGPGAKLLAGVEYLGADSIVTCAAGEATLAVRAPGRAELSPGDPACVDWASRAVHVFDAATGQRRDERDDDPSRRVLVQLMIMPDVLIVENYRATSALGLLDTIAAIGLPYMASAFGTFLLRQTFKTVPRELDEAARVEGAGWLTAITAATLMTSAPLLVAFLIFQRQFVQSFMRAGIR